MHFAKNSVPKRTQLFAKTQIFFRETQFFGNLLAIKYRVTFEVLDYLCLKCAQIHSRSGSVVIVFYFVQAIQ